MDNDSPQELPEPEVWQRYKAGDNLSSEDHMFLQTYLMARCLWELEHVCNNTQMQMTALGEILEKVDD